MSLPHSLLQAWSNLNTFKAQVFHIVCSLRVYHTSLVKTSLKFLICRNTIKSHIFHQPYFPKHLETELDYINFCSWRRLVCLSESTLGALGNAKILKVLQNKESWWLFIHSFKEYLMGPFHIDQALGYWEVLWRKITATRKRVTGGVGGRECYCK